MSFLVQQLRQFIFVLTNHGDVVLLGTLAITVLGLGPVSRAIAARIRGARGSVLPPDDPALLSIKGELSELQSRLDFSERVLLEVRQRLIGGQAPERTDADDRVVTPV